MKIYQKHTQQKLPITVQEAWDFLSDPKNLSRITPEEMGFTITSGADRKMYPGQLIQYTVTPLLGIKMKWVTEITNVQEPHYFSDIQLYGPYALWHHKHFIKEIPGGVIMEDIVDYKLPGGIIGQTLHPVLVQSKLDEIFEHRFKALHELFGEYKEETSLQHKQEILA